MADFYSWIRNVIIFLILASLINQIIPDSGYKKYIKVCTGMILVIVAVWPMISWSGNTDQLSYFLDLENVRLEIPDFSRLGEAAKAQQVSYVTKRYKLELEQQVFALFEGSELNPVHVEVDIVEAPEDKNYGSVTAVEVTAVRGIEELEKIGTVNDESHTEQAVTEVYIPQIRVLASEKDEKDVSDDGADNLETDMRNNEKRNTQADAAMYSGTDIQVTEQVSEMKKRISKMLYVDESKISIDFKEGGG